MYDFDEIEAVMVDSPVAGNHGRRVNRIAIDSSMDFEAEERPSFSLDSASHEALESLRGSAQTVASGDETYHGMVAHRGVLTEREFDELLDWDAIRERIGERLGHTFEEIDLAYSRPGRPSTGELAVRSWVDRQLLEIQESGGNMQQLAVLLGWPLETTPTGVKCRKMVRALQRARAARDSALV